MKNGGEIREEEGASTADRSAEEAADESRGDPSMGLTTEEEIGSIFIFFYFLSVRWKPNRDVWPTMDRRRPDLTEGGRSWPSDEETLETRVNRIEDKPLVYLQFGNRREECFD